MGTFKNTLVFAFVFIQSSQSSQFQDNRFTSGSCKTLFGESRQSSGLSGGRGRDEGFLTVGDSYWVPYGDRTVAAMSFPADRAEDSSIPVGFRDTLRYGRQKRSPYGWGEDQNKKKPKSTDFGVVVSRNSVFKRNFRDYAGLSTFEGDCRTPQEHVVDLAKQLQRSQLSRKKGQSFVVVAFESRLKTPSREDDFSRRRGDSDVLHNGTSGTIIFPTADNPELLTTIPFFVKNLEDLEANFGGFGGRDTHEEIQIKLFVKMLSGIHKDTFKDGRSALKRFQRRSLKLTRPSFGVSVEETRSDRRDDSEDRRLRERIARDERDFRDEAWFSTSSIGIRTISSL